MTAFRPFTAEGLLTEAQVDPGVAVLLVVAGGLYLLGVRRLADRGRPWSRGRSVAFASGLVVVAVATQSGLAAYDTVLFGAHVTQHLLLGMLGPLLLVLGAPVTLALQASKRGTQTRSSVPSTTRSPEPWPIRSSRSRSSPGRSSPST